MPNLTRASNELFRRGPDERYQSLAALSAACQRQRFECQERWLPADLLQVYEGSKSRLQLSTEGQAVFDLTDWSFGQVCRLAGVAKETVNRLTPETAGRVLAETLPKQRKPFQVFSEGSTIRAVHPVSYTRLYNAELVELLQEFSDFQPPHKGLDGATGLYLGEQDLFCFLIDPAGWIDIEGQAFAPGFFVWNSEVGRRTVGIQTFWFQAVCCNHIVWDAVEVVEFTRRHTSNVHEALGEIRRAIEKLVAKRDERQDSFAKAVTRAMQTDLGHDADAAFTALLDRGIARHYAKQAIDIAGEGRRFTIFALVDAMTRLAGELQFAGDRAELDQKASSLLELALAA